jgi:hypothetical protein
VKEFILNIILSIYDTKIASKLAQAVMLQACIWKMTGLNLRRGEHGVWKPELQGG